MIGTGSWAEGPVPVLYFSLFFVLFFLYILFPLKLRVADVSLDMILQWICIYK